MTLQVTEIFHSIEGETTTAGFPATFVRLTGCNLNCSYCDSKHALSGGRPMKIADIISEIQRLKSAHHVTVTGGEPLIQSGAAELIDTLCGLGYNVQVETNGSLPVSGLNQAARIMIDVKTPSSNAGGSFLMENLNSLKTGDEIKFVICSEEDYDFACRFLESNKPGVTVNFSTADTLIPITELAYRILRDSLNVRLNIQLHKILHIE